MLVDKLGVSCFYLPFQAVNVEYDRSPHLTDRHDQGNGARFRGDVRRHLSVPHSIDPVLHTEERGPQTDHLFAAVPGTVPGAACSLCLPSPFLPSIHWLRFQQQSAWVKHVLPQRKPATACVKCNPVDANNGSSVTAAQPAVSNATAATSAIQHRIQETTPPMLSADENARAELQKHLQRLLQLVDVVQDPERTLPRSALESMMLNMIGVFLLLDPLLLKGGSLQILHSCVQR